MLTGRVRFGPFEADPSSGELWRDGVAVPIQDLPFRLLVALLDQPGQLVRRSELTRLLWGSETFVDAAAGLNTAVAKLREALGDDPDRPAFIETVPKRGYRFVGRVEPAVSRIVDRAALRSVLAVAAIVAVAIASIATYQLRADRARVRVAVVLFDNETGDPALAPFAQGMTDATVTELTREPRLAVIGNAAMLRTSRPFRDIAAVRDALNADYIVIGQVQTRDGGLLVRAHLIRAADQSHVWVDAAPMAQNTEAAFQSDVAGRIRSAVMTHVARGF